MKDIIKFSKYPNARSKDKIDIDIQDYIEIVQKGTYQDLVLKARAVKSNETEYKALKIKSACVMGSCTMNAGEKTANNINEMNGLIVIDIDDEVDFNTIKEINNDQYTMMSHRSFGGDGVCIFVKINPNKFIESFNELAQYYWDKFNLLIDESCKNKNRLRFFSYDPYLYLNENSKKFVAKTTIKKKVLEHNFVFLENDFNLIIDQIQVQGIDLCKDDYDRYVRIGFAIASNFGTSGFDYFKVICQHGSKYDPSKIERHYNNFSKSSDSRVTIATVYHYAKDEGLTIYSEKTKDIINRVSVAKSQGNPTLESIKKGLDSINNILTSPEEDKLIDFLIESKKDFKLVDEDETESKQLQKFITENYAPFRDSITQEIFINNVLLDDKKLNTIYFSCKNYLDFSVSKNDVRDMINSEHTPDNNAIKKFFAETTNATGIIDKYVECVHPKTEYNKWAFKKWIIGCVHNWVQPMNETKVSPLTLVLCGQKQGTGKTSFFRNLLPDELKKYLIEHKIDAKDKDSIYNLVKGLLVLDDEFGGLATKDVKDFKKVADSNLIDIRLPYSAFYSKMKRRASLCGTSNESDVLKDVTGNRRILPINVSSIDYDEMIKIDTDELWREAFKLYKSGEDWKIYSSADIEYLELNTTSNLEVMPVEEMFFNIYSIEPEEKKTEEKLLNQGQILQHMNVAHSVNITKYDIKDIFTKNKIHYKTYKRNGKVIFAVRLFCEPTFSQPIANQ
jgi:hypothetical protein